MSLPARVLAWYGDDFTGSTDVLEVLASSGLDAALFLTVPEAAVLERFSRCQALGLAGSSRSQSPAWMDRHLPEAFAFLRSLGAATCHYKVCSTFDSAPHVGNIGRAIEIGASTFGSAYVPLVVGAPALGRYTAFGNLYAAAAGEVFRLDRHPTMSRHPVTPMAEADLRLHLAAQTSLRIELLSLLELNSAALRGKVATRPGAVLFDVLDAASLAAAGSLIWDPEFRQPFLAGSSGVEYALTAAWRASGEIGPAASIPAPPPAGRILVLSGSCSPVTERQIRHAGANGFELVPLDAARLARRDSEAATSAVNAAIDALNAGRSPVLYSAAGAASIVDPGQSPETQGAFRHALGEQSGRVLARILDQSSVRRVIVAGGDTSSHAGVELQIDALTFLSPQAPGAPLCRAWSRNPARDGIEIVFKGGQCGRDDFFSTVKGIPS